MSESTTAKIIPFPPRTAATVAADPVAQSLAPQAMAPQSMAPQSMAQRVLGQTAPVEPGQAEDRLTRALTGLNNAVTAQRAAMAAWRSALGDLRTVTGRLGASLRSYNDSLGHLDARVNSLRSEAVKLEAWADDVLAKKG